MLKFLVKLLILLNKFSVITHQVKNAGVQMVLFLVPLNTCVAYLAFYLSVGTCVKVIHAVELRDNLQPAAQRALGFLLNTVINMSDHFIIFHNFTQCWTVFDFANNFRFRDQVF